jgi:two-component system NtrC family response regulator
MSAESRPPDPLKRGYDRTSYILVVDDDNTLLKFFKIHLNKFFSKVIVVKNAKEAIESLADKEIDLVISDIRMPRMDGLQLMKKIRKHDPAIPILLISGALLSEDQAEKIDDADGYLRKPFEVDALHQFISTGMEIREQYKRLLECIPDKQSFRDVLRGRIKLEKAVNPEHLAAAKEIIDGIKKAS